MKFRILAAGALALVLSSYSACQVQAKPGISYTFGKREAWQKPQAVASIGNNIWTIDGGTLYRAELTGEQQQVGAKNAFDGFTHLAAVNGALLAFDGTTKTLHKVGDDGTRTQIGESERAAIRFMTELDDELWAIENDGTLYRVDSDGVWSEVIGASWPAVEKFFSFKGQVWAVAGDTLYRADRAGVWELVGAVGGWKGFEFMVPARNSIWMVRNGNLVSVNRNGKLTVAGRGLWRNIDTMIALNGTMNAGDIYCVRSDGSLFLTLTK